LDKKHSQQNNKETKEYYYENEDKIKKFNSLDFAKTELESLSKQFGIGLK